MWRDERYKEYYARLETYNAWLEVPARFAIWSEQWNYYTGVAKYGGRRSKSSVVFCCLGKYTEITLVTDG